MSIQMCTRAVEFRATDPAADGDGRTMEGYAAVFGQETEINSWEGHFTEKFARGAFRKTLKERSPILQFNHGRDSRTGAVPIGVFTQLREDSEGLFVSARLFDNPIVEPVRQAIEGGALSGMSISFRVLRDEWRDAKNKLVKADELNQLLWDPGERGPLSRTVREVQLAEAGPVVFPAYEGTSVGVRMGDDDRDALLTAYRQSMLDPDSDMNMSSEVQRWLDAETAWRTRTQQWLAAETAWRTAESEKKTSTNDDAARAGTSPHAGTRTRDAARTGTSRRRRDTEKTYEAPRKAVTRMNIHDLTTRAGEITDRLQAIGDEHRDIDLPDEAQAEWDELETELADNERQRTAITERTEKLRKMAADRPELREHGSDRGPSFVKHRSDSEIFDLNELRAMSYGAEDFLERVSDHARHAVDTATYGATYREGAQERVTQLLDEVDSDSRDLAKRILLTGSRDYVRGFAKVLKHGNDAFCSQEERQMLLRAQTLVPDAGGGYSVPFQLDPSVILTNAGVVNPIRNLARIVTITGKQWQGVTTTGTSVTRGAEGATAPDSSFTLAQPTVMTNRVQGFVPFSIEIELSWSALASEITRLLVDAKSVEENSFITGDGTGVNPGGVIATLPGGQNVTTGSVGTFVYSDVYKLHTALPPRWEQGASFLAHKGILNLIRQFDTAGGAQFWGSIAYGNPNTILDYKVERASAMDSTVATGKKIILYGNFEQFLIVDRLGMTIELVPHVFDAANANRPTGQRGVYAVWMNNSKILVPSAFNLLVVQ